MFARTKRYRGILIVSGLILLFIGCASIPLAPKEMDLAAKRFEPPEGKANIYVTRTSGIGGHLLHLVVDGKFIGSIAYNTYFLFEVDPGTHTVAVLSINMEFVTLGTEAGQNYFLAVGARMGLVAGQSWIEPLDDEEGREAVLETSLGQELELAPKINVEESQGR